MIAKSKKQRLGYRKIRSAEDALGLGGIVEPPEHPRSAWFENKTLLPMKPPTKSGRP